MESGDLSADLLADRHKGSNGLPQKTMPAEQLLDPAAEDSAARLADDQTEVLEQATDLVLEITLDLDQLGPAAQDRPDLVTREALDLDFLVPTTLHDPGQAHGIVAVVLVDPQRQRRS